VLGREVVEGKQSLAIRACDPVCGHLVSRLSGRN
jgi:hypothetical protein